jgi:hypothetical protein
MLKRRSGRLLCGILCGYAVGFELAEGWRYTTAKFGY